MSWKKYFTEVPISDGMGGMNSPLGGAFEYYTNDDYLTEEWQPRVEEHRLELFTEWAIEGGLDDHTRRQVKPA